MNTLGYCTTEENGPSFELLVDDLPLGEMVDAKDNAIPFWIIDDDRSIRWVLEKALTRESISFKSFASADEALAITRPLPDRLAPLPLHLLDPFPTAVDSLRRAGLHTLGDVLALPPAALGRRCGREFTQFLQQLLGQREDRQADYRPPASFSDEYWFGYEVKTNGELLPAVQLLLRFTKSDIALEPLHPAWSSLC